MFFATLLASAFVAMRLISLPPTNVTVIWLPAGIAVLALRRRFDVATMVTLFLAHWSVIALANDYALWSLRPWSLTMAAANTAGPILAVALWRRFVPPDALSDPSGFLRFAFWVALVPSVLTAWVIPAVIWTAGYLPDADVAGILLRIGSITLSSILGVFLVVPIAHAPWAEGALRSPSRLLAIQLANLGCAVAIAGIGFQVTAAGMYLAIPYALVAVTYAGPRGLAIGLLAFISTGLMATSTGLGPFSHHPHTPLSSLFEMGIAALCLGVPAYYAGLLVRKMRRHREELSHTVAERTAELQESQERYRLATEAVSEGIFDWQQGQTRSFYNTTLRQKLGSAIADNEMSWTALWRQVHPHDRSALKNALRQIRDGHADSFNFDGRVRTATGGWNWFRGRGQVIALDKLGRPSRIVGTFNDIELEKQRLLDLSNARDLADSRERAKTTFLANMSHEIRTPMHAMLGFAQILDATELDPKQRECIDAILNSGNLLLELLNDLLDLSRIEAGAIELNPAPLDTNLTIGETVKLFESRAEEQGVALDLTLATPAPPKLLIDRLRLHQVVANLISNAVKFTRDGLVTVTVKAEALPQEDAPAAWRITAEVTDTGIGIAPEQIGRLFNPFVQADSTITRRFGGTGLGLAISQRLCELMGGSINVTSQEGHGSVFTATFVATEATSDPTDSIDESAHADGALPAPSASLDILVVEDNPLNRKLAGMMLQRLGHRTTFAENGNEAVERTNDHPFDAVLMDLMMPELDGFGATQAIRRRESLRPRTPRVPIIALTANAEESEKENCLQAGMDDFLTKPLDLNLLGTTLDRVCSGLPPRH